MARSAATVSVSVLQRAVLAASPLHVSFWFEAMLPAKGLRQVYPLRRAGSL